MRCAENINAQSSAKQLIIHRKNNFDFLRLLLASFVIIAHSYPLSGLEKPDLLSIITDDQANFAEFGVKGFFIISGYLIFQSLRRSKNIGDYYWKRFLRLYPALIVMLLITVIFVPLVYESTVDFLHNKSVLTYLPNNLRIFKGQGEISGVFENNPYPSAINGSLWTIRYEVCMYIILSGLFIFRKNNQRMIWILIFAVAFLIFGNIFYFDLLTSRSYLVNSKHLLSLGAFFMAGSLLAAIKFERLIHLRWIGYVLLILTIVSIYFHIFDSARLILLPPAIIFFGLQSTPGLNNIGSSIGDLSYGVYIYGFPVQQTLTYFFKFNYLALMVASLLVSFLLAYASWHLIEQKALQYKKISFPNWKFRSLFAQK